MFVPCLWERIKQDVLISNSYSLCPVAVMQFETNAKRHGHQRWAQVRSFFDAPFHEVVAVFRATQPGDSRPSSDRTPDPVAIAIVWLIFYLAIAVAFLALPPK
jgi:hypothetical protein